jgi:hypothetical protein
MFILFSIRNDFDFINENDWTIIVSYISCFQNRPLKRENYFQIN